MHEAKSNSRFSARTTAGPVDRRHVIRVIMTTEQCALRPTDLSPIQKMFVELQSIRSQPLFLKHISEINDCATIVEGSACV